VFNVPFIISREYSHRPTAISQTPKHGKSIKNCFPNFTQQTHENNNNNQACTIITQTAKEFFSEKNVFHFGTKKQVTEKFFLLPFFRKISKAEKLFSFIFIIIDLRLNNLI